MYLNSSVIHRGQERVLDPLELELKVVVIFLIRELATEFGSSAGAVCALKTIFSAFEHALRTT